MRKYTKNIQGGSQLRQQEVRDLQKVRRNVLYITVPHVMIMLIYFGINSSMVDSLFIFAHIVWGSFVFGPWFVVSFLVLQSPDSELAALLFIVFLQSCDCYYSVSFSQGTVC